MTVIPPLTPGLRTTPRRTRQDRYSFESAMNEGAEEETDQLLPTNLSPLGTPLTSLQTLDALAALTDEVKPKVPANLAYGEKAPAPRRKTERRMRPENENYAGEDRRRNDRRGKRSAS